MKVNEYIMFWVTSESELFLKRMKQFIRKRTQLPHILMTHSAVVRGTGSIHESHSTNNGYLSA